MAILETIIGSLIGTSIGAIIGYQFSISSEEEKSKYKSADILMDTQISIFFIAANLNQLVHDLKSMGTGKLKIKDCEEMMIAYNSLTFLERFKQIKIPIIEQKNIKKYFDNEFHDLLLDVINFIENYEFLYLKIKRNINYVMGFIKDHPNHVKILFSQQENIRQNFISEIVGEDSLLSILNKIDIKVKNYMKKLEVEGSPYSIPENWVIGLIDDKQV